MRKIILLSVSVGMIFFLMPRKCNSNIAKVETEYLIIKVVSASFLNWGETDLQLKIFSKKTNFELERRTILRVDTKADLKKYLPIYLSYSEDLGLVEVRLNTDNEFDFTFERYSEDTKRNSGDSKNTSRLDY